MFNVRISLGESRVLRIWFGWMMKSRIHGSSWEMKLRLFFTRSVWSNIWKSCTGWRRRTQDPNYEMPGSGGVEELWIHIVQCWTRGSADPCNNSSMYVCITWIVHEVEWYIYWVRFWSLTEEKYTAWYLLSHMWWAILSKEHKCNKTKS